MKTPRDILLARHQTANTQLDSIRDQVVAAECRSRTQRTAAAAGAGAWPLRLVLTLWRELIRPAPRVWTGFALAWLVLAAVNFAGLAGPRGTAARSEPAGGGLLNAWREQENILAELNLNLAAKPTEAEQSKPNVPKPRSDRRAFGTVG